MAKHRLVNTKFWTDGYILDNCNSIDKLAFLYLITNPYTNISGIYELSLRIMAMETGIDIENLKNVIFPKFEKDIKAIYRNGWVAIKNFQKHQTLNPKVVLGIEEGMRKAPIELGEWVENDSLSIEHEALSHSNPNTNSNLNSNPNNSGKSATHELVNYFYELKKWNDPNTYKEKKSVFGRHARPAKELIGLCEGNLEEAKKCLKIIAEWADTRELDWSIETVFKKWYDLDILKPKEKKPYYQGNRIFEMGGSKYVLMPNGEKLKFAGKQAEITYK